MAVWHSGMYSRCLLKNIIDIEKISLKKVSPQVPYQYAPSRRPLNIRGVLEDDMRGANPLRALHP